MLTDAEYATISDAEPFAAPAYPGPLVIPNTATATQVLQLKDEHAEKKRICLECKNAEKALQRHMQDSMEDKHTAALVDKFTNLITDDMPTALDYLFYNYGKVSSEEVSEKEAEIMAISWNPSDPIILITRPLEQLRKIADHAGVPHTNAQILEKALSIMRATRDYEYALTMWDNKDAADKTWSNLKKTFP